MIKTLNILLKQDKERFVVPKGVQDVIPVKAIYDDGIFQVGRDKFTRSFKFTDINYAVASREDKEAMFLEYSELLNSLDSGATTKITINNRRLNRLDFEKTILMPLKGDALDEYREEYNKMLLERATGANAYTQEKYITISVNKKNVEEARSYFARVGADLIAHFGRLGSKCVEMETDERLRIFHDFYRAGEETSFRFDMKETRKKGHDFKDFICPDSMEFEKDYFKIGERYGRVLFLREYASYIKDAMVAELTDLNRNLMLSIDVVPVPTDEAVREAENRLLGVETNVTNWQRRQNSNNNFSAQVPYDLEQQRKEMKEFLDDLTTRDQRMMFAVLTMVHTADSKEQLDSDTEALLTTARKHLCQFGVLKFQQLDGLNTVMPFGTRKIDTFRTLTTESLAVFIPFRVQDIYHENGIYYGQNVISKNMIIADRRQLLNGNEFILGVSGGGKSFAAKGEIINQMLSGNADIIIIDPEREYSQLVKAMGGEIINISATSPTHINAMDMNREYGDGANPVILKSEFIMSLCEQLIGGNNLGAVQKSIIDRCTASVYRTYQQNDYKGEVPTLQDFRAELLKQSEPEAQEIALAIELFTNGSLNTFAKHTNVDTDNRLICYDILDLGKQLMPIGMLVVLDSILNRITQNRAKGKNTFIFIDEIYLLFQHEYSANFLFTLWKRVRKYGAYASGITQNVDDLLQSHTLEMSGSRAVWKEVLAVYSVKVNTDPDEPMEVATMDDTKKQLLKDIFWEMNSISSRTESNSETVITETDDGNGNIVQTETTETRTTLYITVSHKTVEEMADQYGFNEEQREYLAELLEDKNNSLWAAVLYGIRYSDDQIVTVALSQVGNVGGEPYWSWYGFGSRVEWCACFVSWCANECGYIETGVIPKFAGCVNGVQWFKDRGQWIDGSAEPVSGMIIFFDWDNKGSSGPQDGQSDHVGIVQKVENGIVYTVEGNSGDSCRVNQYSVGHYEVLGYGVPQY